MLSLPPQLWPYKLASTPSVTGILGSSSGPAREASTLPTESSCQNFRHQKTGTASLEMGSAVLRRTQRASIFKGDRHPFPPGPCKLKFTPPHLPTQVGWSQNNSNLENKDQRVLLSMQGRGGLVIYAAGL